MNKQLEILATPMDDKNFCRFTLAVDEIVPNEVHFRTAPNEDFFVKDLFEIDGVVEVLIDKNYLIIQKLGEVPWTSIGKTIGNVLRLNHHKNGLTVPSQYLSKVESNSSTEINVKVNQDFLASDLGKKLQEIIDLQIQPSLGSHGGSVRLLDLVNGELFVVFSGGCQGCSQASVTVKDGIEKIIKAKFPEVTSIRDLTNHSSGHNPYFK